MKRFYLLIIFIVAYLQLPAQQNIRVSSIVRDFGTQYPWRYYSLSGDVIYDSSYYIYSHDRGSSLNSMQMNNIYDEMSTIYNVKGGLVLFDTAYQFIVSDNGYALSTNFMQVQHFDNNNNILTYTEYWNDSGASKKDYYYSAVYDSMNHLLSDTTYNYFYLSKNIIIPYTNPLKKLEKYNYDASGKCVLYKQMTWIDSINKWADSLKTLYFYNNNADLTETISENYSAKNNKWDTSSMIVFIYKDNQLDTEMDYNGQDIYLPTSILPYTYSKNNDTVYYPPLTDTNFGQRLFYIFRPDGKMLSFLNIYYKIRYTPLLPSDKINWAYNLFGQPDSETYYAQDTVTKLWNMQYQYRYHYEDYYSPEPISINVSSSMNVYPSPATNSINIDINWDTALAFSIRIYNTDGKLAMQWNEPAIIKYKQAIPTSELPAGNYFIKACNPKEQLVQRVVLLR